MLFDPVLPTLTALAVFLPGTTIGFLAKERARRAIRARFAYFLPPALIGRIEANPEAALTPEGAERELSVMFVDMRGFSTVTEGMPPDRVVQLVNTYLSAVAETLVDRGATIDKFMGDAVMAFWNAPIAQEDHAATALTTIADVEAAAAKASAELEAEGYPPVRVAIGLNTGKAYVGLMGSRDRLSYTCVGDAVTLAARLEGLTRSYGVSNCVGPEAAASCPPGLRAIVLDRIAAKGFARAVDVSLVVPAGAEDVADFAEVLSRARTAYLGRDWDVAEAAFTELARQTPSFCETPLVARTYLDRIALHRQALPRRTGTARRWRFPNGDRAFGPRRGQSGSTRIGGPSPLCRRNTVNDNAPFTFKELAATLALALALALANLFFRRGRRRIGQLVDQADQGVGGEPVLEDPRVVLRAIGRGRLASRRDGPDDAGAEAALRGRHRLPVDQSEDEGEKLGRDAALIAVLGHHAAGPRGAAAPTIHRDTQPVARDEDRDGPSAGIQDQRRGATDADGRGRRPDHRVLLAAERAADETQRAFGQLQADLAGAAVGVEHEPVEHDGRVGRQRQRRLVEEQKLSAPGGRALHGLVPQEVGAERERARGGPGRRAAERGLAGGDGADLLGPRPEG
jgi:class 3 adenylate cyclase